MIVSGEELEQGHYVIVSWCVKCGVWMCGFGALTFVCVCDGLCCRVNAVWDVC